MTNEEEALIDRAIAVVADTIDLAMGCKERILLVNLFLRRAFFGAMTSIVSTLSAVTIL